jgi:hypothetical protein
VEVVGVVLERILVAALKKADLDVDSITFFFFS